MISQKVDVLPSSPRGLFQTKLSLFSGRFFTFFQESKLYNCVDNPPIDGLIGVRNPLPGVKKHLRIFKSWIGKCQSHACFIQFPNQFRLCRRPGFDKGSNLDLEKRIQFVLTLVSDCSVIYGGSKEEEKAETKTKICHFSWTKPVLLTGALFIHQNQKSTFHSRFQNIITRKYLEGLTDWQTNWPSQVPQLQWIE